MRVRLAGTASPARFGPLISTLAAALAGVSIGIALTAATPVRGVMGSGEAVSVGLPLVRVLFHMAAATTVGLGLLAMLVGDVRRRITESVLMLARSAAVASAAVWAVTAFVLLVLQTVESRPGTEMVTPHDLRKYVTAVNAGKALLVVAALAVVQVVVGVLAMRHGEKIPAQLRVGLGLFALLPLPITGHAGNERSLHDVLMVSVELHVLSVVIWAGGLGAIAVLLLGSRALLAHALPRFSRLATWCLLVSAVAGLFNGIVEIVLTPGVTLWPGLFTTPYGQLMLLKCVAISAIALLGGYTRWWLLPRILRHRRSALATWITLELSVMGLAFGFAVVLARTPVA